MADIVERLGLGTGVRELKLGTSFTDARSSVFHTLKYDFKPASVDDNKMATMDVGSDNTMVVTVPNFESAGTSHTIFKGSQKPYSKECVLIIDHDTGEITLERLSANIQVKKTRKASPRRNSTQVKKANLDVSQPKQSSVTENSQSKKNGPDSTHYKKTSPSRETSQHKKISTTETSQSKRNPATETSKTKKVENSKKTVVEPSQVKNTATEDVKALSHTRTNSRTRVVSGKKKDPTFEVPGKKLPSRCSPHVLSNKKTYSPTFNNNLSPQMMQAPGSLPMIGLEDDFDLTPMTQATNVSIPQNQTNSQNYQQQHQSVPPKSSSMSDKTPSMKFMEKISPARLSESSSSSSSSSSDSSDSSDNESDHPVAEPVQKKPNNEQLPTIPTYLLCDDLKLSESESDSD